MSFLTKGYNELNRLINENFEELTTIIPLLMLGIIALYPMGYLFYLSFFESGIFGTEFAGFGNYLRLLTSTEFHQYLTNTAFYSAGTITISFLLGFTVALCLDKVKTDRIRWVYMALILLSWAIPLSVTGLIWRWIFNGDWGLINSILVRWGMIGNPINFLGNPDIVWYAGILTDSWARFPFFTLVIYAGLQTIPAQLYEAGTIDGASIPRLFRHITLPLLKGPLLVSLLIQTMFAFRTFTILYTLTSGGPGDTTTTLAIYIYKQGILKLHFGYSSAISVVLLLFCLGIAVVYASFLQAETMETGA